MTPPPAEVCEIEALVIDDADEINPERYIQEELQIPLALGSADCRFKRERHGFILSFYSGSRHLTDVVTKSPPWNEPTTIKKAVKVLKDDEIFKKHDLVWLQEQMDCFLADLADRIENDPDASWVISSPIVRDMFKRVHKFVIWPAKDRKSTIFDIQFDIGGGEIRSAEFTPDTWSSVSPKMFNTLAVGIFLKSDVVFNYAEWADFKQRLDEIGEQEEEDGVSFVDDLLDEIIAEIRKLNITRDPAKILDYMSYGIAKNYGNDGLIIHVNSRFIKTILERNGISARSNTPLISKAAHERGYRYKKSDKLRYGPLSHENVRTWTFRSDRLGITEDDILKSESIPDEEEEDVSSQ